MDGYVFESVDQPCTLLLTYYSRSDQGSLFASGSVSEITPVGVEDLCVTTGEIKPFESDYSDVYQCWEVPVTLCFHRAGTYELEYLDFYFGDEVPRRLSIGTWRFEICAPGELAQPLVYNDYVATNRPDIYRFGSATLSPDIKIERIYCGEDRFFTLNEDTRESDRITLENIAAPVFFVKPKITAERDGRSLTLQGSECFCGGLDVDEEDILRSRQHAQEMQSNVA
ncbi:hypothetical protein D1159_02945 [Pseudoflavonifractor sp. 524-17]|nr:hypothetical protein [Pseudoflavonifractor sp. 524-17]